MKKRKPTRHQTGLGYTSEKGISPIWFLLGGAALMVFWKREEIMASVIGYVNGVPTKLDLVKIDAAGHQLRKDAAAAYMRMRGAAAASSPPVTLVVNTAFRDMAFQERLYALYQAGTGNLAAKPGFSNHQGGIAVDIETANGTNPAFVWLNNNAFRFGFKRTVASEPWHWEFFA
jgi:hypothetical protein